VYLFVCAAVSRFALAGFVSLGFSEILSLWMSGTVFLLFFSAGALLVKVSVGIVLFLNGLLAGFRSWLLLIRL
jgi:hypothetical protein